MTNIPRSERAKWIGASESAALFGISPYVTKFELWHLKAGTIPPHDLDRVERVQAGQFLEPSIAEWASHKWHWPLRNVAEYTPHPRIPGMGASLDFATLERVSASEPSRWPMPFTMAAGTATRLERLGKGHFVRVVEGHAAVPEPA